MFFGLIFLLSACSGTQLSPSTTTSVPGQIIVTTTSTASIIPNTITSTPSETSTTTTFTATPIATTTGSDPVLKIHFIDVGQGDAILIDLNETEVLIDGGDRSPGVCSYLYQYVDGDLEAMIATHVHADHIGGLIAVLQQFNVDSIWHNGDTSTSKTYLDFMDAAQNEGALVSVGYCGESIQCGDLSFMVLNSGIGGTVNNNSIVLELSYGEVDFLFTGDAEHEAEQAMLNSSVVSISDIEILKVGHHGSITASGQDFLAATKPEIAIYMAGIGNTYGHPHQETITALQGMGTNIYGTDVNGTIIVSTDGKTYQVESEKRTSLTTNTSTPTASTTSTTHTTTSQLSNIVITSIFYDGIVPKTESDEYVEITNLGDATINLQGWVLKDLSGSPSFIFPSFDLNPGQSIRVYTNEIHPETGGFSFSSSTAIWNNSNPDIAILLDDQGQEVSRLSY